MDREQIEKWRAEAVKALKGINGNGLYWDAYAEKLATLAYNAGRAAAMDEAITLCNNEANMRWVREKNPLPGDNPTAQGHKAVTARGLACSIAALAEKETQP